MNILLFILCLVPQSVDTLWTVEFSSQPSGWIPGPFWEYTEESVYLYLQCSSYNWDYYFQEDSLISPDFVVPLSADSLVLVFDQNCWIYGGSIHPYDWARSISTLDMYSSSTPYAIELWEIADSCGGEFHDSYSLIDSSSACISLTDVFPRDTPSFAFRGFVESHVGYPGEFAEANIEWNIYTFSILNYPSVSLEPSTWGMIKASF